MKAKGSMTVTMSLLMMVILGLLTACIQSARVSSARVKAANAVDTGLYSLFSEYQPVLLENYGLFFLDAGYGEGNISQAQLINQMEAYMEPVLDTGITNCRIQVCAVDGYRTAAEDNGKAARRQMIRYMKQNLGNMGLETLQEKYNQEKQGIEQQETVKEQGIQEEDISQTTPMAGISETNNPLEIVRSIREHGFLGLTVPADVQISEKTGDITNFLSRREIQQGMGDIPDSDREENISDRLFLAEYVLEKLSCFTEKKGNPALDYQVEYILGGKDSDRDNLQSTVNQLISLREVSNLAFLYTDTQKRGELKACAAALSIVALIPQGMELVQAVLAAGWAYVESICDVRTLLSGGKIPLVKDGNSWKTQLNSLSDAVKEGQNADRGLSYQSYLRLLLAAKSPQILTVRCMDMIEQDIRKIQEYENFAFDSCIESLSAEIRFQGPERQMWNAQRVFGYEMSEN